MSEFKSKGPELLVDLAHYVAQTIKEMAPEVADKAEGISQELASKMALHWGGQLIYFPQGLIYRLSQRDLQIYKEFNGENQADLAKTYHLSLQQIYNIIKAARAADIARRQGGLFTDEDSDS